MIKGIDVGYLFTKDSDHRIYRSAYSLTDNGMSCQNMIMINGIKYYFGAGDTCADTNKIYSTNTAVCMLADIAMSGQGEYNIVSGLPIVQYVEHKDEFRQAIMDYNHAELVYKGSRVRFNIIDADILPQGAGALYSIKERIDCILFDIGSYTINIAMFENEIGRLRLSKSDTIFRGVLHLYEQIIKAVNSEYDLTLDSKYAENILLNGLTVHGQKIDTSFTKDILIDYLRPIFTQFKTTYPYQIYPILLLGGGGKLLQEIFKNNFADVRIVPEPQFANALGYYQYGLQKWR